MMRSILLSGRRLGKRAPIVDVYIALMELVWPSSAYLPSYAEALERGWSPDNLRPEARADELDAIRRDPAGFLAAQVDLDGRGPPIVLAGGREVQRLPGYHRWMWDGEFCGAINFRWQPGTAALPPYCLGHIGYGVVPWKQGRGYATRALACILPDARARGLPYVEITTDLANVASQKVIERNGGIVFETFFKPPEFGGAESLRYRIQLV
jgi:predicted acetyltransferase